MSENALADTLPFNHKTCDVPGYEHLWVRFKTYGYPRKLRAEWDSAQPNRVIEIITRYVEAWEVVDLDGRHVDLGNARQNAIARAEIETRIVDLNLPIAERTKAKHELGAMPDALGDVEDAVIAWLVRVFLNYWINELIAPRKNLLPLSSSS